METAPIPRARRVQHARRQLRPAVERDDVRRDCLRLWLGAYLFLVFGLVSLWQFAYMAAAIRRFYLAAGRWGARLLSVAAAMLIYVLNTAFMTAVQVAGAAIALASF